MEAAWGSSWKPDVRKRFAGIYKEYRTKKIMEMYGDSAEEAKKSIERSDEAGKAYYESITHKRWWDSQSYELCVDSTLWMEDKS